MIKHLGEINVCFLCLKNALSQESPKRGITPILQNEIQALNKCLKILIGVSL